MAQLSVGKSGLVGGSLLSILHATWSAIVAAGWAQWMIGWIFRLHFIDPPYRVTAFDLPTAAALIGITFVLGALGGVMLALIWNFLADRRPNPIN